MRSNLARSWAGARRGAIASLALVLTATTSACVLEEDESLADDGSLEEETAYDDTATDTSTDSDALTIAAAITPTFRVTLTPETGISGRQRVNFAVPLPAGRIADANQIRVAVGTANNEVSAARRILARYPDGSPRSVQIQVDVDVTANRDLGVQIATTASTLPALSLASMSSTLVSDAVGPKVWAALPATWLAASGVAGPIRPQAEFQNTALDAWRGVCDATRFNSDAFIRERASAGSWLYDRPTALFRIYAMTGQLGPLKSAWREAGIYRVGTPISGGVATTIPVPGAASDLKYHYAQGMAIHYLLTGDDRFREGAEAVAARVRTLWTDPGYAGGSDFWTERHAGFALLAYEWAAMVSDDRAATFVGYANAAVDAYLRDQGRFPAGYTDTAARCFAHTADAAGEDFGTTGCSPWMSAILADGLDAHQRRVGGTRATQVKQAVIKLARIIVRDGRDTEGRPFYWMGVGGEESVADDYDEHWGESAYIVGMAWNYSGRTDATLRRAADELVAGLKTRGEAGQLRSFNWQCRSAVATPFFLR
jgi:hypothetical protein